VERKVPWGDVSKQEEIESSVRGGSRLPEIEPSTTDATHAALVKVIDQCLQASPTVRPTVTGLVLAFRAMLVLQ